LLTVSKSRPEGRYNHATWEIKTRAEVDSNAALIASVHEAMHDQLNNCTAYGLVLIVVAHLAREGAINKKKLSSVVGHCLNAHEIFATYTSLLIVSETSILQGLIEQDYPRYAKYVKQAQYLMQGVEKNHIQYPLINSLIRVCFQNPALRGYLNNDNLLAMKATDSPNRRLILLSRYLNAQRLQSWLHEFVETHDNPDEARRFIEAKNDLGLIMAEEEGFNIMGQSLSNYVYEAIRTDEGVGFAVMGSDEHLVFLDDLLSYADKLAPMATATMPIVADKDYDKINAISMFESEAVLFNDDILPAVTVPFAEFPCEDWSKLLVHADGDAYLYIISRITERFVSQYAFSEEDKRELLERYPDFVVAIPVKQVKGNEPYMLLVVLDSPEQIEVLDKEQYPMLANSSMLLTSDVLWAPWYDCLASYSSHTLLFDLSPSVQLERSLGIYEAVYYQSFHLQTDAGEFAFIILIGKGKNMATGVFFMPCSAVMSNLLLDNFQYKAKGYRLLDLEKDVSEDLQWLLRVQMTRLLDESRFDFKAVSSQYAIRGFEDDRFHCVGR